MRPTERRRGKWRPSSAYGVVTSVARRRTQIIGTTQATALRDRPREGPARISPSIDVYRPQAESFGGRSDGKFGDPQEESYYVQVLTRAGDN